MKRIATALTTLLLSLWTFSQNSDISHKQFQSIIPQSPNAASLGKYGEIPVSTYTGIPSISIPIYEINTGKLKLPITLSYHAGGIKVEEIASWAGLGWSVSAGGQVTRQVRGLPDEAPHGFLETYRKIYEVNTMTAEEKLAYFDNINAGEADGEPDIFSYNAAGLSGEFFYDTSGNVITNPLSKIKITGGNGWVITDNAGTTYYFAQTEFTTATTLSSNAVTFPVSTGVSAWLLSKIVNVTGTDSIVFEYETNTTHFTTISSQTRYHFLHGGGGCTGKPPALYSSQNEVMGKRLKKIVFNGGEIRFNINSSARLDLPDDHALESVEVLSGNGRFYQKYTLHQHFSASNGAPAQYSTGYKEYYRLILDSVTISDNNAIVSVYKMEYNMPEQLPHRLSYDQDYWGYYNAAGNGSNFAPAITLQDQPQTNPITYTGANRKPSTQHAQKGMLTRIIYPTGGYTEFEYESNKALAARNYADDQMGSVSLGSSLNGGSLFTSPMFHIPYCGQQTWGEVYAAIQIILNAGNCSASQNLECPLVNIIDSASGANIPITASGMGSLIANRTYYIQADLSGVTDSTILNNFYVMLTWNACTPIVIGNQTWYEVKAGGQRIKTVKHFEPASGTIQAQNYNYNMPGKTYSSGFLTAYPEYTGTIVERHNTYDQFLNSYVVYDCHFLTVSSGSNYPLLSTRGGTVGYSFVTETEGINGANGKKEYSYISPYEMPDIITYAFPYPPATSYEWRRGYPVKEAVYKSQNGIYSPVSTKTYTYTAPLAFNQDGVKAGKRVLYAYSNPTNALEPYEYAIYSIGTGIILPVKDTTITYSTDNSGQTMSTTNETVYNLNNYSPAESQTKGGGNKTLISKTKYPVDYLIAANNTNPVCAGIRNLAGYNLLNIPVESYTIQKDETGAAFVVSGTIRQFYADRPLPEKVFVLKTITPVPLASFTVSYVDGSGNFIKDSRYKEEVSFNGYDAHANLKGQQKKDNIQLSYIYDYKNSLPVAQVVNASQDDIAYTSFEADGKGGWNFNGVPVTDNTAPTGSSSYTFGAEPITRSLDAAKTYVVSFWKKGTLTISAGTLYRTGRTINGWTYVEYTISNTTSLTISGAGSIDELRLYPKRALMTTYTFEPLLGVTSQSDMNGNIAYYEYDTLGRLVFIKDTDKNIIKAVEYQYQKPVTQ